MPFFCGNEGAGGESQDGASASHHESMTNTDMDFDMKHLEQSKTCDDGCCDHSEGCKCGGCFCEVRADIQNDANRDTYSGEGGSGVPIAYGELSTDAKHDSGVNALAANLASINTDVSVSLPIAMQRKTHSVPLIGLPSFHRLRELYAHESVEDRSYHNLQYYMKSMHGNNVSDVEYPGDDFVTPIELGSESEHIPFEMDEEHTIDIARVNSNEQPSHPWSSHTRSPTPHTLSDNVSAFLRQAGTLFESEYSMARSDYHIDPPLGFLRLVPECRHAAGCA